MGTVGAPPARGQGDALDRVHLARDRDGGGRLAAHAVRGGEDAVGGDERTAAAEVGEPRDLRFGERLAVDDGAGGGGGDQAQRGREEGGEARHAPDPDARGHPRPGGLPAARLGPRCQATRTPSTARPRTAAGAPPRGRPRAAGRPCRGRGRAAAASKSAADAGARRDVRRASRSARTASTSSAETATAIRAERVRGAARGVPREVRVRLDARLHRGRLRRRGRRQRADLRRGGVGGVLEDHRARSRGPGPARAAARGRSPRGRAAR